MSAKMDLNEPSSVDHSDEDEIHSASEDSDTGTEDDGNDVVDIGSGADNEDGEDADEVEPVSEVPEVVRPMEQRGAAAVVSRCGKRPSENLDYRRESGDGGAIGGRGSRLLRTLRRSGRRALAAGPIGRLISEASAGSSVHSPAWPSIDIVSLTIHCQMWHVTDLILSYLDAVSVKHCEDVCVLWRNYIRGENVWRKLTQRAVLRAPTLAFAVGWSRHLPALGGKEPRTVDEFKQVSCLRASFLGNFNKRLGHCSFPTPTDLVEDYEPADDVGAHGADRIQEPLSAHGEHRVVVSAVRANGVRVQQRSRLHHQGARQHDVPAPAVAEGDHGDGEEGHALHGRHGEAHRRRRTGQPEGVAVQREGARGAGQEQVERLRPLGAVREGRPRRRPHRPLHGHLQVHPRGGRRLQGETALRRQANGCATPHQPNRGGVGHSGSREVRTRF